MHVPWWCKDWEMMIACDRVGWTAPPFCSTFCIWNVNCRLMVYWKCKGDVHLKCRSLLHTETSALAAADMPGTLWGQHRQAALDLICIVHWVQHLCYDTRVQVLQFSLHFVTLSLPKEGNNWVSNKPMSAYASDFFFFTIASVRFFFLNGYSGVTQQLKGKTFKYLMSLNCSKTEIIVFLQIWVNIMDCETRPMIM